MATTAPTTPVFGRTRWRRVGILLLPTFALVAALVVLVAKGALAVNLAVSGQPFILSATSISAPGGFVQYAMPSPIVRDYGAQISNEETAIGVTNLPTGGTATETNAGGSVYEADTVSVLKALDANHPVVISGLHQTVCAPMLPTPFPAFGMLVSLDASQAMADSLLVNAPAMFASSATFKGIQIGADAGAATGQSALSGLLSQAADSVTLTGVKQVATNTLAGSFTLNDLQLNASFVKSCS